MDKLVDLRQTTGWAKYLQSQGWEVEELKVKSAKCKVYIRKIPWLGSVMKIQRPEELPPFEEIDRIAKKHRALLLKLEPLNAEQYNLAAENGFAPDTSPNLAAKTIIIDLTKSEQELWDDLSQDARQSVRKAQNNRLKISGFEVGKPGFEEALNEFHKLLEETGRRGKFWTPRLEQLRKKVEIFGKDASLFLAYSPNQPTNKPLAGTFLLMHDGTHSASSKEGQNLYAPYLLLWETMKGLKAEKIKYLDLAGVYDPRFHHATRHWQGFTAFKRKFGGTEIEYPSPLIKYYHPLTKLIFKIGRLGV